MNENEKKKQPLSRSHHQTNTGAGFPFLTDSDGEEGKRIRGHRKNKRSKRSGSRRKRENQQRKLVISILTNHHVLANTVITAL